MTLIGPQHRTPSRRPAKIAKISLTGEKAGTAITDSGVQDLVQVTGGSQGAALVSAAKNAGDFLLRKALPLVGAVVAGVPGLIAGAVVTGALDYLDKPEQSTSSRWKSGVTTALKTGVVAGLLGVPGAILAPLGPIFQTTAAVGGTVASFALDRDSRTEEFDYKLDLGKLSNSYARKAEEHLREAGHSRALDQLKSPFALTKRARDVKARVRLTETAAITSHHLGPAVALAIMHQVGRDGIDSDFLNDNLGKPYGKNTTSIENIDGTSIHRVENLKRASNTSALALLGTVFLDDELPALGTSAKTDFIVGHEKSHVQHEDSAASLAEKALKKSIAQTTEYLPPGPESHQLTDLYNDLNAAGHQLSHEMEFRADADGFAHARKVGHSVESIQNAAKEILTDNSGNDEYQNHPASSRRLEVLKLLAENDVS